MEAQDEIVIEGGAVGAEIEGGKKRRSKKTSRTTRSRKTRSRKTRSLHTKVKRLARRLRSLARSRSPPPTRYVFLPRRPSPIIHYYRTRPTYVPVPYKPAEPKCVEERNCQGSQCTPTRWHLGQCVGYPPPGVTGPGVGGGRRSRRRSKRRSARRHSPRR